MTAVESEELLRYKVVANDEEQFSIWPAEMDNPSGWHDAGKSGSREVCLSYIAEVWTDLRPLSLRSQMSQGAR